jgi:hypothetical protein
MVALEEFRHFTSKLTMTDVTEEGSKLDRFEVGIK